MTLEPVEEVTRFVVGSTTKFLCLVGKLNSLMGFSAVDPEVDARGNGNMGFYGRNGAGYPKRDDGGEQGLHISPGVLGEYPQLCVCLDRLVGGMNQMGCVNT